MRLSFYLTVLTLCTSNVYAATTLAKINNQTITLEDFNNLYQANSSYYQFAAPDKKTVLNDMIKRELGVQEAKKKRIHLDPKVQEKIDTVLYQSLLEKELSKDLEKIDITTSQMQAYYNRYPEIRTRHVFIGLPNNASAQDQKIALEKIRNVAIILKKGKNSFEEVAKQYSEGVAARLGGDIDYQSKDRLDPAYYDAALKLKKPGAISEIVKSQYGYHIIKLTAIKPWKRADKVKYKRILFENKKLELFEKYMAQLKSKAQIQVNWNLIQ